MADRVVDVCLHQWTTDLSRMKELVPEKWGQRLAIKERITDQVAGTLMPSLPWYAALWNEDAPDADRPDGAYTNSAQYRSPERFSAHLADVGVEAGILCGHQMQFLPALPSPEYAAALASAYNRLLAEDWLAASDRLYGAILVTAANPEAAVAEIEAYADHPRMVTVLVYAGGTMPLGHEYVRPIFEAADAADLPVTIHTSGNPTHRQTAGGRPGHFVTFDANVPQNLMVNFVSMAFQGVFDAFPDLDVVWAGGGVDFLLHPAWRSTRYYRNLRDVSPDLEREPVEYMEDCYFTTYPLGVHPPEDAARVFDVVGPERVLFGSGYPLWNADAATDLPDLPAESADAVLAGNAREVYGI